MEKTWVSRLVRMTSEAGEPAVVPAGAQQDEQPSVVDTPIAVARNSAWLLASQGLVIGVYGAVGILAVRLVSTADWGRYSTAMALIGVLVVVSELGITTLALREMSSDVSASPLIYGSAALALCVTSGAAALLLAPSVYLLSYSWSIAALVALAAPLLLLQPLISLLEGTFNAHRLLRPVAELTAVQCLAYAGLAVPLLLFGGGVKALVLAGVASMVLTLGLAAMLAHRYLGLVPRIRKRATHVRPFLFAAAPIGAIGMITIVYDRFDVLLLARLSSPTDVAHYTVPYSLVKLTWVIPSVVSLVFFPVLNSSFERDRVRASEQFFLVVRAFFMVSLPLSLFLAVGGSDLLPFVFGSGYKSSAEVLQIMAWTSVLGFQNYIVWYAILAARLERRVTMIMIAGLAFNVVANLILIPRYGSTGAAAALVASDLLVVLWGALLVHRRVFPIPLRQVALRPAVVSVIAVPLSIVLTRHYSAILGASVGAVVCFLGLMAMGYITRHELSPFVPQSGRHLLRIRD